MGVTETPPEGVGALRERVNKHGWRLDTVDTRLDDGAEAFAKVRASIDDLREDQKPKPTPTWKVASVAIALAAMVIVWVWQAAKYPDREEFNAMHGEVQELKLKQVEMQANIEMIKASQDRSEKNIDKLLVRIPPRPLQ